MDATAASSVDGQSDGRLRHRRLFTRLISRGASHYALHRYTGDAITRFINGRLRAALVICRAAEGGEGFRLSCSPARIFIASKSEAIGLILLEIMLS